MIRARTNNRDWGELWHVGVRPSLPYLWPPLWLILGGYVSGWRSLNKRKLKPKKRKVKMSSVWSENLRGGFAVSHLFPSLRGVVGGQQLCSVLLFPFFLTPGWEGEHLFTMQLEFTNSDVKHSCFIWVPISDLAPTRWGFTEVDLQ